MTLLGSLRVALTAARRQEFTESAYTPVDDTIRAAKAAAWSPVIDRKSALQVPAVARGRNTICDEIATLPLVQYDPAGQAARSPLLEQIDPQKPNLWTLAYLIEDLLCEAIGWWHVLERGWNDFPTKAERIEPSRVVVDPAPTPKVRLDGREVPLRDMIRFDSPNPPLLVVGKRAITRALLLERAAERYARNPRAQEYFTPSDGADPAEDDEIAEILADWVAARNDETGGTAYVPASLEYHAVQAPTPADLQLVQLQTRAALDIANLIGLDPEDLGINVTSRTYQNVTDRRIDRINGLLAPYMQAITGRLSMDDVTRRGYTVSFDLTDYLRADPTTAANVSQVLSGLGAITTDEIRARNGLPPLTAAQKRELAADQTPAADTAVPGGVPAAGHQEEPVLNSAAFAGEQAATFTFDTSDFRADAAKRTVSGVLLPFNAIGRNGEGRWRFAPGSVDWNRSAVSRVKLNREHDRNNLLGAATTLKETPDGISSAFKVARGPSGDQALSEAEDEVLDGLSAEVDILDFTADPQNEGVYLVTRAVLKGAALTGAPAFDDARLTSVAASDTTKGTVMTDATTGQTAPAAPAAPAPADAQTFTREQMDAIVRAALAQYAAPAPGADDERPAFVNPASRPVAFVSEPVAYRFDRGGNFAHAQHEFSTDLVTMLKSGDFEGLNTAAGKRVMGLVQQAFSTVVSTDVNELTPTANRPDMFVDQRDYKTPLWNILNKGATPNGVQPFTVPQFSSAAGLVGDHTEGTEPTGGTYVTTSQTITPTALSGKASITRETWDMGGNPAISTLVWNQMKRGYYEGLETAAGTFLNTLTAATDINLGVAVTDEDLAAAWDSALADLQFVRTYDFSAFAIEQYLYKAFVNATDGSGRKLFPIIAPQNANGTAQSRFRTLDLSGVTGVPAWGLGAGTGGAANNSWLFDPAVVHGWATAPQRLELLGSGGGTAYKPVAFIDLAVWGYKAFANTDIAGVRQVIYDNA